MGLELNLIEMEDTFESVSWRDLDPNDSSQLDLFCRKTRIYKHEYLCDKTFKTRNWNLVIYPDSAPEDWIQQLITQFHVPFCVSPLHNSDLNATGEPKKAHWHLTLCFDGPKNWQNVIKITKWLNGPVPIDCVSLNGSVRYMAHLDNPEKYQYDPNLICGYCGFNVEDVFAPSQSEMDRMIANMIKFIKEQNVTSYLDFIDYCIDYHYQDWFKVLNRNDKMVKLAIKELKDLEGKG